MRILLVDDELDFSRVLRQYLGAAGYEMVYAATGAAGLALAREAVPDLVLLDVRLPDMDGCEACAQLRAASRVPIIIISALGNEQDIVRGLFSGADDYLAKPFRISELLARVRVQLRRSQGRKLHSPRFDDGYLVVDPPLQRVEKRGERLYLSRIEHRLLGVLVESAGRVVTVSGLASGAWGEKEEVDAHRVALYISYLRRKIEDDPRRPRYIHTVRGKGYWFGTVRPESEGVHE